jgi:CDP-6-deoxy-D-xylo-4-hexulose-3-dehydrase
METQAAMGRIQLKKLTYQNENRKKNYEKITTKIKNRGSDKLTCFKEESNSNCIWFSIPFILNSKYEKNKYLEILEKHNIETRPIVTGNFTRQPVFSYIGIDCKPESFINAEIIHKQGFFIGLPAFELSDSKIDILVNILISS